MNTSASIWGHRLALSLCGSQKFPKSSYDSRERFSAVCRAVLAVMTAPKGN